LTVTILCAPGIKKYFKILIHNAGPVVIMNTPDDSKLDDKLRQAQQELAAIKHRYAAMPPTTVATVRVPTQKQTTLQPPQSISGEISPISVDHPAQKQLEIAEGVMLKLYKKNLALEHQIRQLNQEVAQLKNAATSVEIRKTENVQRQPTSKEQQPQQQHQPHQPRQPHQQPQQHVQNTSLTKKVEQTPVTTTAALREELLTQRASCARFAAQNRALRSDFTRLAQQKIQPLLNSSSVGHASQEVLSLLAATLQRFETERTAEVSEYDQRLKQSEEAHIETLVKLKMLTKQKTSV
jgi:hypothetical protein